MIGFGNAYAFTYFALIAAGLYGALTGGNILGCIGACILLAILEISLSFDNAVVNAKTLATMHVVWRDRFITWGMPIAVIGMRLLVPIAIVACFGHISPSAAFTLALHDPKQYGLIIAMAHVPIMGFGGAFLMLVGLKFFFDQEKDTYWLGPAERVLQACGRLEALEIVATLLTLTVISATLSDFLAVPFLVSGFAGIATFFGVEWISDVLQEKNERDSVPVRIVDPRGVLRQIPRAGLASFIYLEMLDASCSFDGVIGAFAVSNNLILIALGLGIGAMFIRSMTLELVRRQTLAAYRYLEHGAFWAILALAACMLLSIRFPIPDLITGVIGAAFIGAAYSASVAYNRSTASESDLPCP